METQVFNKEKEEPLIEQTWWKDERLAGEGQCVGIIGVQIWIDYCLINGCKGKKNKERINFCEKNNGMNSFSIRTFTTVVLNL